MANSAKKMGRPAGEPTKVVRLPLPVAALARRLADIAVVDRSRVAVDRSIVLALIGGEFTIKRYRKKGARVWLQAENPNFKNIELNEDSAFEVWGVIAKSIRML